MPIKPYRVALGSVEWVRAITSNDAPDSILERRSTASLSVGTAIRLIPRLACCGRGEAAEARQEAKRMYEQSLHFMTNTRLEKSGSY
jgi:hypothetical protein